MGKAYAAHSGN